MAKLIYASNMSLDGWTEDARGAFDWAPPDDDVFVSTTDLMRSAGTYLYGRRLYDTMAVWETEPALAAQSDLGRDFANAWQAADKVVYSRSLPSVSTQRTRIERELDPGGIRRLKAESSRDISNGGPGLAAQAIAAGLVDELHLLVTPIVVGGGTRSLPDGVRWELELLDEHRFAGGFVHLHYRTRQ